MSEPTRLALLYPVGGSEWEYYRFADALDWQVRPCLFCTPLYGEDHNHDPAALRRTAALGNLARTARSARPLAPHAALWACTSGSFILGRAHAEAQASAIAEAAGCPASSTSLAFADAVAATGASRVALLASYPAVTTQTFVDFLGEYGIEVTASRCLDIPGGQDAAELPMTTLLEAGQALAEDRAAEALLVPDTAIAGFELVRRLEAVLSVPVLAANPVTVWQGLRLAGRLAPVPGHGRLLEHLPPHPEARPETRS